MTVLIHSKQRDRRSCPPGNLNANNIQVGRAPQQSAGNVVIEILVGAERQNGLRRSTSAPRE
jgi:hypothetical protein